MVGCTRFEQVRLLIDDIVSCAAAVKTTIRSSILRKEEKKNTEQFDNVKYRRGAEDVVAVLPA